jgi:hypothetical protein
LADSLIVVFGGLSGTSAKCENQKLGHLPLTTFALALASVDNKSGRSEYKSTLAHA